MLAALAEDRGLFLVLHGSTQSFITSVLGAVMLSSDSDLLRHFMSVVYLYENKNKIIQIKQI